MKRKTTSKRSSLSVTFATHAEELTIENTDDISEDEKLQCWFTSSDYQRIRDENNRTSQMMNQGLFPDSPQETFRGLENHMDDYIIERRHTIHACVDAILNEQHLRYILDPIWVDHTYSKYTYKSQVLATRAGNFDANVAMHQC
ncbi:MAG: hypothetical protein SGARI_000262 [Bacillariaceae sp.]